MLEPSLASVSGHRVLVKTRRDDTRNGPLRLLLPFLIFNTVICTANLGSHDGSDTPYGQFINILNRQPPRRPEPRSYNQRQGSYYDQRQGSYYDQRQGSYYDQRQGSYNDQRQGSYYDQRQSSYNQRQSIGRSLPSRQPSNGHRREGSAYQDDFLKGIEQPVKYSNPRSTPERYSPERYSPERYRPDRYSNEDEFAPRNTHARHVARHLQHPMSGSSSRQDQFSDEFPDEYSEKDESEPSDKKAKNLSKFKRVIKRIKKTILPGKKADDDDTEEDDKEERKRKPPAPKKIRPPHVKPEIKSNEKNRVSVMPATTHILPDEQLQSMFQNLLQTAAAG